MQLKCRCVHMLKPLSCLIRTCLCYSAHVQLLRVHHPSSKCYMWICEDNSICLLHKVCPASNTSIILSQILCMVHLWSLGLVQTRSWSRLQPSPNLAEMWAACEVERSMLHPCCCCGCCRYCDFDWCEFDSLMSKHSTSVLYHIDTILILIQPPVVAVLQLVMMSITC